SEQIMVGDRTSLVFHLPAYLLPRLFMGQLVGLELLYSLLGEVPPEPMGAFRLFPCGSGRLLHVALILPLVQRKPAMLLDVIFQIGIGFRRHHHRAALAAFFFGVDDAHGLAGEPIRTQTLKLIRFDERDALKPGPALCLNPCPDPVFLSLEIADNPMGVVVGPVVIPVPKLFLYLMKDVESRGEI